MQYLLLAQDCQRLRHAAAGCAQDQNAGYDSNQCCSFLFLQGKFTPSFFRLRP